MTESRSRVLRWDGKGWAGVEPRSYKEGDGPFAGVSRHTLLGGREGPEGFGFEVRYFSIAPGGFSSLERHRHPHAVVVLEGRGSVRLGDDRVPIGPRDVVYVAPDDVHRFEADAGVTLGFVCVVDRVRDRPVPLEE